MGLSHALHALQAGSGCSAADARTRRRHRPCVPSCCRQAHPVWNATASPQDIAFFDDEAHSSGKLSTLLSTDAAYIRGAVGDVFGARARGRRAWQLSN